MALRFLEIGVNCQTGVCMTSVSGEPALLRIRAITGFEAPFVLMEVCYRTADLPLAAIFPWKYVPLW